MTYGEIAHGYPRNRQVMLNVADGKRVQLYVGADSLDQLDLTAAQKARVLDDLELRVETIATRQGCSA